MADANCTRVHTCAHCGSEFTGRKKKFCSPGCRRGSKIIPVSGKCLCAHCGTEIKGRRKRFCSLDCQVKAKAGHDPAGHKCHECGARFTGRKKKYCSPECHDKAKAERDRVAKLRAKGKEGQPRQFYRVAGKLEYPPGVETDAQKRRWRYYNDPEYQAKEAARRAVARAERRLRKKITNDGTVTAANIQRRKTCLYCGTKLTHDNRTLDHMVPISAGGAHSASNVVECCSSCNSSKGAKDFIDWLDRLEPPHRKRAEREWVKRKGAPPEQATLF